MKILIVGSTHTNDNTPEFRPKFIKACNEIGKVLAKANHEIITCSDSRSTADYHVIDGANMESGKKKHSVIFYQIDSYDDNSNPDTPSRNPYTDEVYYRNISFKRELCVGGWFVAYSKAIQVADVVLAIGGSDRGTGAAAHMAMNSGKPVLAIPSFGGSSSKVWEQVYSRYRDAGLTGDETAALRNEWQSQNAEVIIDTMSKLYKKNPWRKSSVSIWVLLPIVLILIVLFVSLLLNKIPLESNISFFCLLGISSLMGSLARTLLKMTQANENLNWNLIVAETLLSLIIAFILILLYFVGSLVVTGEFVSLNENQAFFRLAVTFSLIGLAAGLLLQESSAFVHEKLKTYVKT